MDCFAIPFTTSDLKFLDITACSVDSKCRHPVFLRNEEDFMQQRFLDWFHLPHKYVPRHSYREAVLYLFR